MPNQCSVEGCLREPIARGLCDLHYRRWRRHGSPDINVRPDDWGKRRKHPLDVVYRWLRRSSRRSLLCKSWQDDFWQFVKDVGSRPSREHRLRRLDERRPYGPTNFHWQKTVATRRQSENDKEYARRYQQEYRAKNPDKYRGYSARRRLGLAPEEFDRLVQESGGVCAICGNAEKIVSGNNGKTFGLALDHDHRTGKVRGFLCATCNRGLGLFNDDADLLKSAIAYLRRHKEKTAT